MAGLKKAKNNHITVINYEEAWLYLKDYLKKLHEMNQFMGAEKGVDFSKMMEGIEKKFTSIEKVQ